MDSNSDRAEHMLIHSWQLKLIFVCLAEVEMTALEVRACRNFFLSCRFDLFFWGIFGLSTNVRMFIWVASAT